MLGVYNIQFSHKKFRHFVQSEIFLTTKNSQIMVLYLAITYKSTCTYEMTILHLFLFFFLQEYERRIADMEEAREKALQELTEHYEVKLEDMKLQLEQASDEQRHQLKESEELQRQTEEDADREILDVKNNYERKLRQRWEENTKLRGEVGILSKKVGSLQEEIKNLKDEIQRLKQEVKKRDGIIASLKTDIEGLKKEIQERDDTIQDKVSMCTVSAF